MRYKVCVSCRYSQSLSGLSLSPCEKVKRKPSCSLLANKPHPGSRLNLLFSSLLTPVFSLHLSIVFIYTGVGMLIQMTVSAASQCTQEGTCSLSCLWWSSACEVPYISFTPGVDSIHQSGDKRKVTPAWVSLSYHRVIWYITGSMTESSTSIPYKNDSLERHTWVQDPALPLHVVLRQITQSRLKFLISRIGKISTLWSLGLWFIKVLNGTHYLIFPSDWQAALWQERARHWVS